MTSDKTFIEYLESKFGWLEICANDTGISAIRFIDNPTNHPMPNPHTQAAVIQLNRYFQGKQQQFDLSLNPHGTDFQHQVWRQLAAIEYGQTCSYADIAKQINNPKAVRAVGAANGRNPICIVVPCHRVIGKNGTLTGYAWGTNIKAELLALEKANRIQ